MNLKKNINYYSGDRIEMLKFIPGTAHKILDIGCGQGKFGEHFIHRNKEVWGVEPIPEAALIAEKTLSKVLKGKIEDVIDEIPENYFDIIVLNDVLEHLIDPWEVTTQLRNKLHCNARDVASVPNFRYITNLFELIVKRDIKYTESGILDSTHLRFFTRNSIIRLFTSCGYTVEVIKGIYKTKSFFGISLAILINVLSFTFHRDIYFKEFVIIASKTL